MKRGLQIHNNRFSSSFKSKDLPGLSRRSSPWKGYFSVNGLLGTALFFKATRQVCADFAFIAFLHSGQVKRFFFMAQTAN